MNKTITRYLAAAFLSFVTGVFITYGFLMEQSMPLVHKLQAPLLFNGANATEHQYILPAGTSLYFDQAFPEGFVRYKVYFNVEGIRLESQETTDKFWLDPLTAFPPNEEEIKKMLKAYPLGKNELAAILKSSYLTKEEIRELLLEYSK